MINGGPNLLIYCALIAGFGFFVFSLLRRSASSLPEVIEFMLSSTAAFSGVMLCVTVLAGRQSLGDFQDQKLTIILGAVAIVWVSLQSIVKLVKGVLTRAELKSKIGNEGNA